MVVLSINPLVNPDPGLFIWSAIAFIILLIVLRKMAWAPITEALAERENFIEDSLSKAEAAKQEMASLISENDALLKQTRAERDQILAEARKVKEQMIIDAKEIAQKEGARMIELARVEINNQKAIAMADVKNQVATLSLQIAEKVLRKQFEDQQKQDELVSQLLKEVKL
ncbi:ATP synthase F0 subcomplex B subunit [Mucilaginibacter pineti]|uniref:ATP synthase subunit b n=1 Tax=Mucilaginibacter pineti TaxID=1391627 RepID=A0A1G7CYH8_9SPHI|nr:F0F1 ATP synthase subunit B [Mucilaginibacter pineti]SDE43706.1 ATP synthase F0 subcomplex B subunit [Mucilaginibacter pineti]